jgi:tetrapyrrole methylase family protein/MazG family protein
MENIESTEEHKEYEAFQELYNIIKRLRDPDRGCAWDLKQTNFSLNEGLIEETFEVVQAIEENDLESLEEELGDLFFVILMQIYVAVQTKNIKFDKVIKGISDKLIRRHPHVFGNLKVDSSEEILKNWEEIKKEEKKNKSSTKQLLKNVPRSLPSLQRISRIFNKLERLSELDKNPKHNFEELKDEIKSHDYDSIADEFFLKTIYKICILAHHKNVKLEQLFQDFITEKIKHFE